MQLDEHNSLNSFLHIYYNFLGSVTLHLPCLPQKPFRHCLIFNGMSPFGVIPYFNIRVILLKKPGIVVNSNPNDCENPLEYNPDEFLTW